MNENTHETIRLLIVSRDPAVHRQLWSMEESNSWHLETGASCWDAMERVQSGAAPHLLLLDLPRGEADGLHLLRWLRRLQPNLPVIVLCHRDDATKEKEATRLGAGEILVRPFDEQQLESMIRRHLHSGSSFSSAENTVAGNGHGGNGKAEIVSENVEQLGEDAFFVSASPIMQKLRAQAALLAQTDVPVLILGERGTGKYTVASLIHKLSVRSGFRLIKVNCAEMPEALLEAELFGEGNGSRRSVLGRFAPGEKGTIYLDEIAAMPVALQARLLHAMQNQGLQNHVLQNQALHNHALLNQALLNHGRHNSELQRSGGDATPADVRILAASSANLERALAEKKLREDLYYRLSAFTMQVPSLRQRKDEVAILLRYLMHKLARHYNLPPRAFSAAALETCQHYSWPGNLKELETFVKRYLVAGEQEMVFGEMGTDTLDFADHAAFSRAGRVTAAPWEEKESAPKPGKPESLKSLIQGIKSEAEQNAIGAALRRTGWNRKAAARLLRVSYRTLLYKIEQYNMRAPEPYLSPLPLEEFSVYGDGIKGNGKAS
ncbi:MAG: sigma-54 dependent transcriptional regulator [Candidatus Sulfotelmatobacter sp.]